MTTPAPLTRREIGVLAGLLAILVFQQVVRLLVRPADVREQEEAYAAAVGYVVWSAGLWDQLLPVQYGSFCGGCTVVGVISEPILGLGGDQFLAWKAIAVGWQVATLVAGFFAADRWAG